MLEVGWSEILVIAVVLIVVVGPKDLPPMLRAFGKMTSRLRSMAGQFQTQFSEALKEADMDDVRKTLQDAQKLNPINTIREAISPIQQMGNELKSELQKTVSVPLANPTVSPIEPVVTESGSASETEVLSAPSSVPVVGEAASSNPQPAASSTSTITPPAIPATLVATDTAKKEGSAGKTKQPAHGLTAEAVKPKSKRVSKPKSDTSVAAPVVTAEVAIKPKRKKAVVKASSEGDA